MKNHNNIIIKLSIFTLLMACHCQAAYLRGADQFILWNDSVDPSSIGYIPNVQYIGQGYNIYQGNPHSTRGLDPGFTNSPLINLDYQNNLWANVNPDRSYFIPDGVRLTVEKSCVVSYTSREITSLKEYRDSLQASIQVQAKYFGGKFSSSVDYSEVSEGLNSSNSQYIESNAKCATFKVDLLTSAETIPKLSLQFQQSLYSLRFSKTSQSDYHDFFDRWGTHAITSVHLGSRFGYKYKLDKQEANRQRQSGINIEVSASYFGSKGSGSSSYDQSKIDNFKKAMVSWSSYSIGATPDANQDALKWSQQTLDTPMPIDTAAVSMDDFLRIYSKSGVQGLVQTDIDLVISNVDKYLRTYCSQRLLPNNRISQCSDDEISDSQAFQYSGKKFRVQNFKSQRYMETTSGNSTDGIQIQQWTQFEKEYQFWYIVKSSSNTGSIVNKASNKCIHYESEQEGAKVTLRSCNNSKNQQFQFMDIAPELFYLKSVINNLYVTIADSNNGSFFYMQKQQTCEGCQVFCLNFIQ